MVLIWASEQSARVRASVHCGVDVAKSLHTDLSYLRLCGGSHTGAAAGAGAGDARGSSGSTRGGSTHVGSSSGDRSWKAGIGAKNVGSNGADVLSARHVIDANIRERGLGASCVACRHDMGEVAIGTPFGRLIVLKMPSGEQVAEVCGAQGMFIWCYFFQTD
jgi:hypothetical protein